MEDFLMVPRARWDHRRGLEDLNVRNKTRGVSHSGLAIYILKSILREKKNYGNPNII
jgi:hypothetical protein